MMTGRSKESGMALLMVLTLISVMLAAGIELARRTGASAMAASRHTDEFMARETAMSGMSMALALLAEDASATDIDSVQEDWASPARRAAALEAMGYHRADLVLDIRDELGKLQVNALIRQYPGRDADPDHYGVLERFFTPFTRDPAEQVNAIQDWLDHLDDDAVTGVSGAESDYYLSLDPPYHCANGPFTHISELFRVKGIGPDLFVRLATPAGDLVRLDPGDFITVHGLETVQTTGKTFGFSGRVNINTAPETVIRALLPGDAEDLAEDIVAYRQERTSGNMFANSLDKGWVHRVVRLSAKEKKRFDRMIRYDSYLFRVNARSRVNGVETEIESLVLREQETLTGRWSCRMLQLKRNR